MARQWNRKISLILGSSTGDGIDLEGLRIVFKVKKQDFETPNTLEVTIYNPSEDTIKRTKKEFTDIVLQAGYEGNFGVIFKGTIVQTFTSREGGTDTYLRIIATSGDEAYNFAIVNESIEAGGSYSDMTQAAFKSMSEKGVTKGYESAEDLSPFTFPRGQVLYGPARKYMQVAAESTQQTWTIDDGKLQIIPIQGYLPDEAVVLNFESGLIGTPEQTEEGIKIRALLNPLLVPGGRVQVDSGLIKEQTFNTKYGAPNFRSFLDADGFYRIIATEHEGDTRGNSWYTDLICVSIDDSAPVGSKLLDTKG